MGPLGNLKNSRQWLEQAFQQKQHAPGDQSAAQQLRQGMASGLLTGDDAQCGNGQPDDAGSVEVKMKQQRHRTHGAAGMTAGGKMAYFIQKKQHDAGEQVFQIHEPTSRSATGDAQHEAAQKIAQGGKEHGKGTLARATGSLEIGKIGLERIAQKREYPKKQQTKKSLGRTGENLGPL